MKVLVKEGCKGIYDGRMYREGQAFTLEAKTCRNRVDEKGNPLVLSVDQQFSANWMEVVEKPRAKPGPKPKFSEDYE